MMLPASLKTIDLKYTILFEALKAFGAFSAFKVNKDKTEALALGNSGISPERAFGYE